MGQYGLVAIFGFHMCHDVREVTSEAENNKAGRERA